MFSTAYSFDQWLSEVDPQQMRIAPDIQKEIPTVLVRKFPMPWQLFAQFYKDGTFDLIQSFEYNPSAQDVQKSMLNAIQIRSLG